MDGIDQRQLKKLITDTLKDIGLESREIVLLLLRTCAIESDMGSFLRQVGGGPALGIFQMEPRTFYDHINWLKTKRKNLYKKIVFISSINESQLHHEMLVYNLKFAICLARIQYLRAPGPIPKDFDGQWDYYKIYYNSIKGASTYEKFKDACSKHKI